ncbi:MAG TPA: hypothetical protein VN541_02035, partial [Tepidisphaeraceae bacterium]|nr:hypothetical protein [Tepidisphaeraceae bacterium]
MSLRAQRLRARLTGAVNRTLSMVYGGSLRRDVRRSFVAVERLEERIVFGNGGVGAHNPPYPLASCSDPSNTSTCQTCPPPPIAAGPGTGGPGHGGPGSSGPGGPSGASGPSGAGPGNGSGNGNGTGKTPILISVGIDNSAPSGSAGTEAPINAFGGMPRISSTDLQSNAFGLNWGISRSWIGMNDTGPIGNGWAIGEMPYLSVDD